jgi:hypothetical protein
VQTAVVANRNRKLLRRIVACAGDLRDIENCPRIFGKRPQGILSAGRAQIPEEIANLWASKTV